MNDCNNYKPCCAMVPTIEGELMQIFMQPACILWANNDLIETTVNLAIAGVCHLTQVEIMTNKHLASSRRRACIMQVHKIWSGPGCLGAEPR